MLQQFLQGAGRGLASPACVLGVRAVPAGGQLSGVSVAFGPKPWAGPGPDPTSSLEMGVHFVKAHPPRSVVMFHPSGNL